MTKILTNEEELKGQVRELASALVNMLLSRD